MKVDPIALYNELADTTKVTIINAKQDEVLTRTDFSGLSSRVEVIAIDGNHDFTNEARQELTNTLKSIL